MGQTIGESDYRIWLKKPPLVRIEAETPGGQEKGILVGDGKNYWIYWTTGRFNDESQMPEEYERTKMISYMKILEKGRVK